MVVAAFALAALAGCNSGGSGSGSSGSAAPASARAKPLSSAKPAQMGPAATLLKSGQPPLTIMFSAGGKLRVRDATDNKTLVSQTVNPGTIIAVDAKVGVLLGRDTAKSGPLSPDHEYEIWWDAGQ